jgi:hypothetical protein
MTSLHSVVLRHECHVNVVTFAAQPLRTCLKIPNLKARHVHEAEHCEL